MSAMLADVLLQDSRHSTLVLATHMWEAHLPGKPGSGQS